MELVCYITEYVETMAATLPNDRAELRTVFHGPPPSILSDVLEQFEVRGGISVTLADATQLTIPVLLPDESFVGLNPDVNTTGRCTESFVMELRNTPACPRYVTLAPPARQSLLSLAQVTDSFGISAAASGATGNVDDWWNDKFVQQLAREALNSRGISEPQVEEALRLMQEAVCAADEVDAHSPERPSAWRTLSRVYSIPTTAQNFCADISLACGFPCTQTGQLHAQEQIKALSNFVEALVEDGFGPALERMKKNASEAETTALDQCVEHLKCTSSSRIELEQSPCYYFRPCNSAELPPPTNWWKVLSAETLVDLLEQEPKSRGEVELSLAEYLTQPAKGLPYVVENIASLLVKTTGEQGWPDEAMLTRDGQGVASRRSWKLEGDATISLTDDDLPEHKSPVRYTVTAPGLKKTHIRVISLAHWSPCVVVGSRTAERIAGPKRVTKGSKTWWEWALVMQGEGRHYLDLLLRPGCSIEEAVSGIDASDSPLESTLTSISTSHAALEITATSECYFDIVVSEASAKVQVRLNVSCTELPTEGCRSEFERLLRVHATARTNKATRIHVQPNRQTRIADLEDWLVDPRFVTDSCYPIVLGPDCREVWRIPDWTSDTKSIISQGVFIHDPRPTHETFSPPDEFISMRRHIASAIRGKDDDGLLTTAELGKMMGSEEFSSSVECYVRAWHKWLVEDPDTACWVDTILVSRLESDLKTLSLEPESILISPLHPLRIGWHCLAQQMLSVSERKYNFCPAASVLDPDAVPDSVTLKLRSPLGGVRSVTYVSTECTSDYWAVLWNSGRLDQLSVRGAIEPFAEPEFGLSLGGLSSGFSTSQVKRALTDLVRLLPATPIINVILTSSSGQSDACNEGVMTWAREWLGKDSDSRDSVHSYAGRKVLRVYDDRKHGLPESVAVEHLGEDTDGCALWFNSRRVDVKPDLGIIAHLDVSNCFVGPTETVSPIGSGGLIRHRVRQQLGAGQGAFLSESRSASEPPPSGSGLEDIVARGIAKIENLGESHTGYTFAPSVQAVAYLFRDRKAEFVAVSSSAVDASCFLGGWLEDAYLWDYELPSYSHRAGDTNGYYLIAAVRTEDCDSIRALLKHLPSCTDIDGAAARNLLLEVARRGIPTVRGLSAGSKGAAGDLGLFLASRVLQDDFRIDQTYRGLTRAYESGQDGTTISLLVPIDPFLGYIQDLRHALRLKEQLRPDLLVVSITITGSTTACKLTPVEVKFRSDEAMSTSETKSGLEQAKCFSRFLASLKEEACGELTIWKVAYQHFLSSLISFGFRVYSQHATRIGISVDWSAVHQRSIAALFHDSMPIEIDMRGRLIVFDKSTTSNPQDLDGDNFQETIVINPSDAARILTHDPTTLYDAIRLKVGTWELHPLPCEIAKEDPQTGETPAPASIEADRREGSSDHTDDTHQPSPLIATPHTDNSAGLQVLVGHSVDSFTREPRLFTPSHTALNQLNIGVVGDLGTGKTQLVKSLVYQLVCNPDVNRGIRPRFLILDYKKDYSNPHFASSVGAKIVRPHHIPLNLFDVSAARDELVPWMGRFRFFADVLDKIYSNVGPVQRQNLKVAVRQAYDHLAPEGKQPTIYDVYQHYLAHLNGKQDSISAIIGDIVDLEIFAGASGNCELTSFAEFFEGVVVLSLDSLGQDDRTKNMVVALMLNMFYENMLTIPKRPFIGSDPQLRVVDSYLLVDEAENIMKYEFDVLGKVLLQCREFGVGVILASQYLRHFKAGATDYREPLLSWFIHKVPNVSAQDLSNIGLAAASLGQTADRIRALPNHHCLYKTHDVQGEIIEGLPFFKLSPS